MNLKFSYVFAKFYGLRAAKRLPAYLVSTILLPLSLLFMLTVVSKGALLDFAIIGGFIELLVTNALNNLSDSAWLRLNNKFKDLLVATGVGPMSYMLGFVANELFFALPGLAVYTAIGIAFSLFAPLTFLLMLAVLLLLYFAVSCVAFALSFVPKSQRDVWGYTSMVVVALTLLPPVYYPYTYLPKAALYAALAVPSTSASMLIQSIFGLAPFYAPALIVFAVEVTLCVLAAVFLTRWREK